VGRLAREMTCVLAELEGDELFANLTQDLLSPFFRKVSVEVRIVWREPKNPEAVDFDDLIDTVKVLDMAMGGFLV
jgi:hypothetical protein